MEIQANSKSFQIQSFQTSIWNETLYKAWSQITSFLIPYAEVLQKDLENFCTTVGADEVVIFEKSTFLLVKQFNRE